MNPEIIEQELVKANITDTVIAKMESDYMGLKVKDAYDKPGFEAVSTARKEAKKFRVACEKLLKSVREPAVAFQKTVVAKEKEISARIEKIEDYLTSQEEVMNPKEIVAEIVVSDKEKVDMFIKKIQSVPLPEITDESEKARIVRITSLISKL